MSKQLIFADLHLSEDAEQIACGEVLPGITKACKENDIQKIFFLGDLYHTRYSVKISFQNIIHNWFLELQKNSIQITLIPGNHDLNTSSGNHALEVFSEHANVKVISEPTLDRDTLWLPYRKRGYTVAELLEFRPRVIMMHQGVRGAFLNRDRQDIDGMVLQEINDAFQKTYDYLPLILSGHYHMQQRLHPNLYYIGSTHQQNVGEVDIATGYGILEDGKFTHIQTKWGRRYYSLDVSDITKLDLTGIKSRDVVKIILSSSIEIKTINNMIKKAGLDYVSIQQNEVSKEARLQVSQNAGLQEYVQKYLEHEIESIDERNELLATFKEIIQYG